MYAVGKDPEALAFVWYVYFVVNPDQLQDFAQIRGFAGNRSSQSSVVAAKADKKAFYGREARPEFARPMKALPRLASGVAAALLFTLMGRAAGDAKPTVEDFARGPAIRHAVLSRDGKIVAYNITFEKEERLRFHSLETAKEQGLIYPPQTDPEEQGYSGFAWAGKDRAIFSLFHGGLSAMDASGHNYVGISGQDQQEDQGHQGAGQTTILNGVDSRVRRRG